MSKFNLQDLKVFDGWVRLYVKDPLTLRDRLQGIAADKYDGMLLALLVSVFDRWREREVHYPPYKGVGLLIGWAAKYLKGNSEGGDCHFDGTRNDIRAVRESLENCQPRSQPFHAALQDQRAAWLPGKPIGELLEERLEQLIRSHSIFKPEDMASTKMKSERLHSRLEDVEQTETQTDDKTLSFSQVGEASHKKDEEFKIPPGYRIINPIAKRAAEYEKRISEAKKAKEK
jgi:hypothetical protein